MKILTTRLQLFLLLLVLSCAATMPFISRASRRTNDDLRSTQQEHKRPQSIPGEILVRFRSDAAAAKGTHAEMAVREDGREIKLQIEALDVSEIVPNLRLARVTPADTSSAIAALAARADVLYAEPNFLRYKDQVPNDPRYSEQYALKNTGQAGGVAGADIKAEPAWDITTGSRSVVVGVVDEGIDINHLDLKDNIWKNSAEVPNNGIDDDANGFIDDINGWDFVHNDNTVFDGNGTFPSDPTDAHGTHVAGTIGATGNNALGVVGVNWQVSIMSLKFLGPVSGSSADLLKALSYAKMMRDLFVSSGGTRGANLKVLNNSYGGVGFSQAEFEAVKALNDSGVLFVAAAGNDAQDNFTYPHYPANYDSANVISVASTTNQDGLSSFSDFGARVVTMGAPGSGILSTTPNNTYNVASGTSMASPHVAGAAALVVAAKPDISLAQLAGALSYSGDLKLLGATRTGRRLNVYNAILTAQENDAAAPSAPAGFSITSQGGRVFSTAWASPGDDGATGTAADYDFFFTGSEPNAQALLLQSLVSPAVAGTQQGYTVTIPYRHATGTITLRSYDNAGNFSDVTAAVNLPVSVSTDPYQTGSGATGGLSTGGSKLLNGDNSVFQGDDKYRANYSLPFGFPFFGQTRNQVTISSNGALYFSAPPTFPNGDAADILSSTEALRGQTMIAGLWDDLVLSTSVRPNDGVYIVRPDANGIIFRWQGATFNGSWPVNFEVELRSDGSMAFRYGNGNTSLLPVVGIAGGEPDPYVIDSYTSKTSPRNLTNAQAVTFVPFGGPPFPSPSPSPSPTPAITPSPTPTPSPVPGGVRQISLATKDLVYDPYSQRIYASVPSSAGAIGNSITRIDPFAGTVGPSVLVGSEPGKLAISDNSQYIYAALDGAATVRRFDVAAQTAGLQFALGSDAFFGPLYAEDLAVVPGHPDSIAISRRYSGVSPRHAGVAIYDNGLPRATTTATHTGSDVIEFSPSETTLYGYNNETTEFGFRKMSVNDSGVTVSTVTTNIISGFGVDILYDSGLIYATTGRVINPETAIQVGTYPGLEFGSPVRTDVPANRAYFLTGAGSSTLTLKAFNLTRFIQTGSLAISGVSGNPGSLIKWGADGLAFRTTGNQIFLISTSAIVPMNPAPPTPVQVAAGIIRLPLATNDLVYDGNTQTVYASVPSSAGSFGNSIAPINPKTGIMRNAVFVGSDPRKLAISGNGQYIYAGLDGSASVRRFDVASQTAGLQFALGTSQFNGPMYVEDMAVMPGHPNTVAISRRNQGFSPRHEGVGIYDDGVMCALTTPNHTGSNVIEYSSLSSTLYGQNNETTEFGFRKMTVNALGVTVVSTVSNLFSSEDIKSDNGRVYGSSGRVINPEAGTLLGTFANVNSLAFQPDSKVGRTYFVAGSDSNTVLRVFDQNTFLPIGSFNIPGVNGTPGSLIRWGSGGLAFRTSGNQVFFLQLSQLPAPIANPIDDARSFVRRHYLDFLSREPDQSGWDFWTNKITQCATDALCVDSQRIGVSAAFFIELEFQQTGYVVYRLYRAAYGTQANAPTRASITFQQFIADRAQLVGGPGLPQSTINFANNFAERPEFKTMYPTDGTMNNTQFVNKLFDTANLTPYTAERQQQIDAMNNNNKTRAQVLLDVIEINEFKTREYNPAFVLMQYYGYLRRNPDQPGYDFWLVVLNTQPDNFRGMVCSFLTSTEYQLRFGTAITRSNQDCGQ